MEPPAKRARHGRAPHDDYAGFAMPMDYNSKNTGPSKGETGSEGDENEDDGDDEDEIAMDPEDYAMKLNPQYRIQKSRAVADNRLKSAFELLFEKYSKDFGDTGDEINFYTDEIEVDNGHITSILAEEDVEDDAKSDVRRNGRSAEEIGRGLSLLSSGPILVSKDEPAADDTTSEPRPATLDDEPVDPVWAAPTIPDDAFSTPKPQGQAIQPPRIAYSVPHRSIFRKSLPESFGKVASAKAGKRAKGGHTKLNADDNDDDLLLMDTSEPILRFSHAEKTPRRRVSNWAGPNTPTDSPLLPSASSSLPPAAPTSTSTIPPPPPSSVLSTIAQPNAKAAAPSTTEGKTSADTAAKPAANRNTETFSRNTLDPSYAFSDDEDFGLKRRNTVPNPASVRRAADAATATPTTEKKRGRGRPRIHPIKPQSDRMPRRMWDAIRGAAGPVYSNSPIPVPTIPPYKPAPQDPAPVHKLPISVAAVPQPQPALPPKRRVGRPRKIRPEDMDSSTATPAAGKTNGQEHPLSSPQPTSAACTPSKPPTQELPIDRPIELPKKQPKELSRRLPKKPQKKLPKELPKETPKETPIAPPHVPVCHVPQQVPPPKRPVGRPKKVRESGGANLQVGTPAGPEAIGGQKQAALSRPQPQPKSATSALPKPLIQEPPLAEDAQPNVLQSAQPQKRRVGRPRKIKPADASTPGTASATPTASKSLAQMLSPPLWQSVTRVQQKRRPGRPKKGTAVDGPALVSGTPVDEQARSQSLHPPQSQPSQELPQQPLRRSPSKPLSQPLLHLPKSPSLQRPGRAEIPDSDATIPSSNTSRPCTIRPSLRSEIPDSEGNLSSSIVTIVSDDESDGSDYDAVEAAISLQRAGFGGSRRSPTHSPARSTVTTPLAAARFIVMPRSGAGSPVALRLGSGRASPLAKSVLRTPSPVKLSKLGTLGKMGSGMGSRWMDEAEGEHAIVPSPSGSVVQTPGGTMRRCGQGGFRCEREFCFKCT